MVDASEASLQYLLGGISKLGGVSSEQLLTKVAGIDNALLRVAAAAGVKIGSELTEEELQLVLEPLYRTLIFGEDYNAPAMEEILYTALLTVITTGVVEGGDIASYGKNINVLLEQSKAQIQEDGEKDLQSGEMPDDAHLEIMELNPPTARGMMAIYKWVNMDDAEGSHTTELSIGQMIDLNMEGNTLTDVQKSRLNTLNNTINDHLKASDFSGTLRDLQGNPVPNGMGGFYDHLFEMKNSYRSLKKVRLALEGSLKNPNLSDVDRSLLQDGLNTAIYYINRIEELFDPYGGIS